jgi:hypothetical protein
MEPIQILELIKEDIRDKFDGDPLMMRTMNLVITEYKARSERLHKHGVSGKQPDHRTIHATAKSYSKDIWGQKDDIFYKNSIKDFEAGAKWALSQVAGASGAVDKTVCDGCEDIAGFYLGTTCPKCNQPFRQVK